MKRKITPNQVIAALPAALWLIDQLDADTRARGFTPQVTTHADIAEMAIAVVRAIKERVTP